MVCFGKGCPVSLGEAEVLDAVVWEDEFSRVLSLSPSLVVGASELEEAEAESGKGLCISWILHRDDNMTLTD